MMVDNDYMLLLRVGVQGLGSIPYGRQSFSTLITNTLLSTQENSTHVRVRAGESFARSGSVLKPQEAKPALYKVCMYAHVAHMYTHIYIYLYTCVYARVHRAKTCLFLCIYKLSRREVCFSPELVSGLMTRLGS